MYFYINGSRVDMQVIGPLSEGNESSTSAEAFALHGAKFAPAATDIGNVLSIRESEFLASTGLELRAETSPLGVMSLNESAVDYPQTPGGRVLVKNQATGQLHVVGRRMVARFKEDLDQTAIDQIVAENDLLVVRRLCFAPNLFELMTLDENESAGFRVGKLHETLGKKLVYIEPITTCSYEPRHRPNDEYYGDQWQWRNDGAISGTVKGADVRAEGAWDLSKGDRTRIAVIDRGFHVKDIDIAVNIAQDASGFFHSEGDFSRNLRRMRAFSHGTFCAAQAAASADDAYGTCGIAPMAKLMLIGVDARHGVSQYELAQAVAFAVSPRKAMGDEYPERGADSLTCAEGPKNGIVRLESVLDDALNYAFREGRGGKGMPVFWAVANRRVPVKRDEIVSHKHVIAVGSSTIEDERVYDCAYGDGLSFLAPGAGVFNVRGSDLFHGPDSGTSFASPIGAGVAALMLSLNPGMSAQEVRMAMEANCRKVPAMRRGVDRDPQHGYGVINAEDCVKAIM